MILENVEYFIAIAPRSTLTRIGSNWKGRIYELSRTVWYLNYANKRHAKLNC